MSDLQQPATLDACAQEAIHIPGAIQPHGMMLVVQAATFIVQNVAGDVEGRLGVNDWKQKPLGCVIGKALAVDVRLLTTLGDDARFVGQLTTINGEVLDVTSHSRESYVVIELEPASTVGLSASRVLDRVTVATAALAEPTSVAGVCDQAVIEFRRLTHFNRVMIYRFNDDGAGLVVAEDRHSETRSFLHHHFPEGDIPAQARALYVHNVSRVIPDASYVPGLLRPSWPDAQPLDMTECSLRSVSPMHRQYLRNMGVRASASFSIVIGGALWGLVICHHTSPRMLTYDVRAACRILVGSLSRQIKAKADAERLLHRLSLRSSEDRIVALFVDAGPQAVIPPFDLEELRHLMDGDGVAVIQDQNIVLHGRCPNQADITLLADWLLVQNTPPVFATRRLQGIYPDGTGFMQAGSGLLSIMVSAEPSWQLIWFRTEEAGLITWAGNPYEEQMLVGTAGPVPRLSFESWDERMTGRSRGWTPSELDTAMRMQVALRDVLQTWQTRKINLQLTTLVQQKDLLLQQKEYLTGEINHRVQNSLQLVSSFLTLQARSSDDRAVQEALLEAGRRLTAVALVHRRLYRDDQVELVDAGRYVEELCADTLEFMGADWSRHLVLDLVSALITPDRAINLGLILTELMINANKHAYGGEAGPIRVELINDSQRLELRVADKGVGAVVQGSGFGSRIMAGLVHQLGGVMTNTNSNPGHSVSVSIPL